jgi:hypothetical protein
MAFKKNIDLGNGYSVNVIRFRVRRVDEDAREAFAIGKFYKDEAAAAANAPATQQALKIRLKGAAFDAFFGKEAMAAAKKAGLDVDDRAIFYRAAKARPDLTWSDFDRPDPSNPGKVLRTAQGALDF